MCAKKNCFVIGPMRDDTQMKRQERLAAIVREAFAKLRRDEFVVQTPVIPEGGNIVEQVLGALDRAAIVIADLTRNNPSVLYELAVRHCMGLPCIHVVDKKAGDDAELAKLARESLQERLPTAPQEQVVRLKRALALLDDLARPLAFDVGHERYAAVDFEAGIEANQNLVDMLCASIKETEDLSAAARNPVTSYYNGIPLTDVSPTSGLALGYWRNFVVRTVASVVDGKAIKILGDASANQKRQETFLSAAEFEKIRVRIWIPVRIAFVHPGYIGKLKQKGDFRDVSLVQDPTGYRDINLLIRPQTFELVDIPTTLRVIRDTVGWRPSHPNLKVDSPEEAEAIIEREFKRFHAALDRWKKRHVEEECNRDSPNQKLIDFFNDRVNIEQLPPEWNLQ
jgi:hypothetical protein